MGAPIPFKKINNTSEKIVCDTENPPMLERVGQLTDNLVTIKENLPGYRGRAMTHASIISRTFLAEIHDLSGIKIPLATLGMRPAENVSGVGWGAFQEALMARKVMLFLSVVTITTTVFAASALARGFVPMDPASSRIDPSLFQNMPEESAGVAEEAAEEVAEEVTEEVGGVQVSNVAVRRPMLPKDFGPRIDEKTLKAMFEAMEWMTTHCGEECEREDSDNLGSVLEIWPGIDCRLSSGDGYEINDNAGISMGGAKAFSVTDLGDAKKMTLICPLRKESMGKITSITVSGKLDNARYSSGSAINLKNPKMPVKEAEESLKVYLHNGTKKEVLSVDGKGDFFKSSSFEENLLSGVPLFLSITSTAAHIDSIMVTYTP